MAAMTRSITKAAAHWLRPELIAWRVQHVEGAQYALLASDNGSLRVSTQVRVGDDMIVSLRTAEVDYLHGTVLLNAAGGEHLLRVFCLQRPNAYILFLDEGTGIAGVSDLYSMCISKWALGNPVLL